MARNFYNSEKRRKELKRKKKQEEKIKRRLEKKISKDNNEEPLQDAVNVENIDDENQEQDI